MKNQLKIQMAALVLLLGAGSTVLAYDENDADKFLAADIKDVRQNDPGYMQSQVAKQKAELAKTELSHARADNERVRFSAEAQKLEGELNRLRAQSREMAEQTERLNREAMNAKERLALAKRELEEVRIQSDKAENDLQAYKDSASRDSSNIGRELQQMVNETQSYKQMLSKYDNDKKSIGTELTNLQNSVVRAQQDRDIVAAQIESAKAQSEQARLQYETLKADAEAKIARAETERIRAETELLKYKDTQNEYASKAAALVNNKREMTVVDDPVHSDRAPASIPSAKKVAAKAKKLPAKK